MNVIRTTTALLKTDQDDLRALVGSSGDSLRAFHADSVRALLSSRSDLLGALGRVSYLAVPRGARTENVLLPSDLYDQVKLAADADRVSVRQFLYTALRQVLDSRRRA